jgi:DNA-binding CsgD family transcriptional regulator
MDRLPPDKQKKSIEKMIKSQAMPEMEPAENLELSDREREILILLATGASNKEIALKLSISANTVKVHLRNIFSKIGAASRTEAAMYAVRFGLIDGAQFKRIEAEADSLPSEAEAPPAEVPVQKKILTRSSISWGALTVIIILVLIAVGSFFTRPGSVLNGTPSISSTSIPRWKSLAAMPTPRYSLALALYENNIYAIGGENQNGVSSAVEIYNPASNSWKSETAMPVPVSEASAAVLGGLIYIPGGKLQSGSPTDILEVYDPKTDQWAQKAHLPTPLSAYGLVAYEGTLYLFGGWNGKSFVNTVYSYSPDKDRWTSKVPMPTARGFIGVAAVAEKIFIIGGYDGKKALATNEVYVPNLDDGTHNPWTSAAPMPQGRYGMGVSSGTDLINILGGQGDQAGDYSPIFYDPQSNTWQLIENPPVSLGTGLGSISQGIYVYVIGGKVGGQATSQDYSYQVFYTIAIPVIIK